MTTTQIYEIAESYEDRVSKIYFGFADRFIQVSRLCHFWREVAFEELVHAATVRACSEQGLFCHQEITSERMQAIGDLLQEMEGAASDPALTPDAAFSIAFQIESSDIDDAYEILTRKRHIPYSFLQQAARNGYHDHILRFARAANEFCEGTVTAQRFYEWADKHQDVRSGSSIHPIFDHKTR